MITSWWLSKKLAPGIIYLDFKRIRTCWGCKKWGWVRAVWTNGNSGKRESLGKEISHQMTDDVHTRLIVHPLTHVTACVFVTAQTPHQLIVLTYISNGKLMGWWVLKRHMVDCLAFEIAHIVPRLFLLFSNGHSQHSVLWIIWGKDKKVWWNEILLSAAVSDMLGGSVTNDLCNYANGESNDVFPRKVC